MRSSLLNRQMPTLFGMILLIALLFGTTMLVRTGILFPIRASDADEPQAVEISNISDTAFTVSYATKEPTVGSVTYGETEEYGTVMLDERDAGSNTAQPHTVHSITISNLKPQTKYFFAVISGSTTYTDNGTAYSVTTAATLPAPPTGQTPVSGSIIKSDGSKTAEAIVYVSTESSQKISTLVKADGSYSIPIDKLRNIQLDAYETLSDETVLRLNIIGDGQLSSVKVTKAKSARLPAVTLSQDYDFTLSITDTTIASDSAQSDQPTFPEFTTDRAISTNPQILTPQKDQSFSDLQPEFTGTAPPNRTIEIVIHSPREVRATVRTDRFGAWSYRPTTPLEPGNHTIEIKTKDEAGLTRTIIQSFIVNAQGSQFTEPSVSPIQTPTLVPSATPTPTRTISSTGVPTTTVKPTTIAPTQQPTPTVAIITTPLLTQIVIIPTQALNPSIDETGTNEVILTVSLATVAMISGAVIFFLTQGVGL